MPPNATTPATPVVVRNGKSRTRRVALGSGTIGVSAPWVNDRRIDEALAALLGDDPAGLSATNIARLTNEWESEYRAFQKHSLADRDYVYVWVDGVHFSVRLEDGRLCTLVIVGVRSDGTKELITVEDGFVDGLQQTRQGGKTKARAA